ncbi:hypothetical protein HK104_006537 [Borealophlyctis nickersoniae]|nr:hypothetical protein HK104_006537 [Borealophlyctis nickersoniae]
MSQNLDIKVARMGQAIRAYATTLRKHWDEEGCQCGFHTLAFRLDWVEEYMYEGVGAKMKLQNGIEGLDKLIDYPKTGETPFVLHDFGEFIVRFKKEMESTLAEVEAQEAQEARAAEADKEEM